MIIIEKSDSKDMNYVISLGEHNWNLSAIELMELKTSLETCRNENTPTPTSRYRVLAPWDSPPEEEQRDEKRDRATLWIGDLKWRISNEEEIKLTKNIRTLTSGTDMPNTS